MLPIDGHVHSQWSWDAPEGSMERTCARAVDIGLPAIVFTDHVDFTVWTLDDAAELDDRVRHVVAADGSVSTPEFDVAGYLESVQSCRDRFPQLRILTGLEIGQPHWHQDAVATLLASEPFDRVLGSLHCVRIGEQIFEPGEAYRRLPADEVIRRHLAETLRLIAGSDAFPVLAHIDYAVRDWPAAAGPYDPAAFEGELREVLRALARSGRALEVQRSLHAEVVRWWYEEGGRAVTFGSDAHDPGTVARGFAETAAMVEAQGFRPGRQPYDIWSRAGLVSL